MVPYPPLQCEANDVKGNVPTEAAQPAAEWYGVRWIYGSTA